MTTIAFALAIRWSWASSPARSAFLGITACTADSLSAVKRCPVAHPFRGEAFPVGYRQCIQRRNTLRPEGLSYNSLSTQVCRSPREGVASPGSGRPCRGEISPSPCCGDPSFSNLEFPSAARAYPRATIPQLRRAVSPFADRFRRLLVLSCRPADTASTDVPAAGLFSPCDKCSTTSALHH